MNLSNRQQIPTLYECYECTNVFRKYFETDLVVDGIHLNIIPQMRNILYENNDKSSFTFLVCVHVQCTKLSVDRSFHQV